MLPPQPVEHGPRRLGPAGVHVGESTVQRLDRFNPIEEAQAFNLTEGSPTLLLNQLFFSKETPVMYIRSVKRQDSFGFAIEFKKGAADERRFYVKR